MTEEKKIYIKLIALTFFLLTPWMNANYLDSINPSDVIQEDLSFYEINPCKISFLEFLKHDLKHVFQDHYFYRFDNSSPISCFGRISGVTLLNNNFYISIGTNSLVNLIYQSILWFSILSFIKKKNDSMDISRTQSIIINLIISYFFTFSIYAENRYYSNNFYLFDLQDQFNYFYLFLIFYIISTNISKICLDRIDDLINYIPYLYLFVFVYSGYNLHLTSLVIAYFGLLSFLKSNKTNLNKFFIFPFSIFWILNTSGRYYLNPGKLRGFSSSIYEFNSNLYSVLLFILILNGLLFIYKNISKNFNIIKFRRSLNITSISLVFLGIIGANFPSINFFNYYFFGQQRYGISENNPFLINQWSEKVSWRGFLLVLKR